VASAQENLGTLGNGRILAARPHSNSYPQGVCRICSAANRNSVLVSNSERHLLKCRTCGVAYLEPQPDPMQMKNHLTDHYISDEVQTEHHFGKSREGVLSRVARMIHRRKSGGRIVDIGCAGGYFLSKYFSTPSWEAFGVEPSRYACARAAERGIRMFQGQLSAVELPADFFDVATLFDTFSYFRDPRQDLLALRRSMRADGLLVIEQPLASTTVWRHGTRLGRLLGGAPMSLLDGGQNFLYEPNSMRLVLRETGFKMLEVDTLPGNKQRDLVRDILFGGYYLGSRLVWFSSVRSWMLGPNFVVTAVPAQLP